ncbi:uncharacterized protein BX664DRAFT_377174 [Halteromyces radiatus]|uniref:uncharacterized protein n=1 Tax=Halteromyces radiatus TaxID=101107 RepID=UPI00221FAE1F|nr:uncharacterized protein BX664DRAFT_377174 [Halteromyces radiatus]KAI8099049.1 hypothetical protein BX664DRAFT_377174 [Halteromyces radiatus]
MNNKTMNTTVTTLFSQLKAYVVKSYATSTKPATVEAKHPEVLVFRNYTPLDLLPFDGHDASRGLAKHSFDSDMVCDPNGPIDKLEDLTAEEWEALREWEQHFATKYLLVVSMDDINCSTSPFQRIPDELQIKILSYLDVQSLLKVTGVCQKWYTLVHEGSLWQTIDITPFYKTIPADQLLKLGIAAGNFLKIANFRGCIQLTGHMLRVLADYCSNIQALYLKDCRGLSTPSISFFLQRVTRLTLLDLSGLETVKNSTLQIIGQSLPLLEKLNLSWCRNITGQGIQQLVDNGGKCHSLQVLKLNGCAMMDEDTMRILAYHLPRLRQLSLASCISLTDTALSYFFLPSSAPFLSHLNVSNCSRLTDRSLRHFVLPGSLTHLELAGCTSMTDAGFLFLSPRLQTLIHLDLEDILHITDDTVKALARHQPLLQHLCLSNCANIDDEAILFLVIHGVCRQLNHLELDGCAITDHCLNTIATHLLELHEQQQKKVQTSSLLDSKYSDKDDDKVDNYQRRVLTIEVLDCGNVSELGVRTALVKAPSLLNIKSFYSWRDEQRYNNDSMDNTDQYLDTRRLHSSIGRLRGDDDTGRRQFAAGQSHSSGCVIL